MSMLTRERATGYARHCSRAEMRAAVLRALDLRDELGLAPEQAFPDDAWALADHLRETVTVVARPGAAGRIHYRAGKPDLIVIDSEAGEWEEAFTLAHECGHHLLTRPTEEQRETWETFYTPERKVWAEAVANAFMFAFMLGRWPASWERDESDCCRLEV
jgi:hypothetical protein